MKRIISLKFLGSLVAIAVFIMVLKSCKKVDNTDPAVSKAAIRKEIESRLGNVSGGIVYPIHKDANEYFYKNAEGKMTSLYTNTQTGVPNGTNGVCNYNCSNTSNPANLVIVATLDYAERYYLCEGNSDKSTVRVKWTISAPFIVSTAVVANQATSAGYLKFTPSSGSPTTFTAVFSTITVTVTYVGPSSTCSANSVYELTYQIPQVNNSYFASGTTVSAAVDFANDCSLVNNLVSAGYTSAPAFSQDGYLPCNRVDAVYINPPGGGTSYATATGLYTTTCAPPSGMQGIDDPQLEYRKVDAISGSLAWADQSSFVYWGELAPSTTQSPTMSPYGGVLNLINMVAGDTWLVRYRNIKTGTCNVINPIGPTNGNWGNEALWITEVWPL